jgi:hypothetical protein
LPAFYGIRIVGPWSDWANLHPRFEPPMTARMQHPVRTIKPGKLVEVSSEEIELKPYLLFFVHHASFIPSESQIPNSFLGQNLRLPGSPPTWNFSPHISAISKSSLLAGSKQG